MEVKKSTTAWDLAKSINQTIVVRIIGPMYGVYYPWRKTADMYVAVDGHPIKCCQPKCEAEIPCQNGLDDWITHIKGHARCKLVKPIVFTGMDNDGKQF